MLKLQFIQCIFLYTDPKLNCSSHFDILIGLENYVPLMLFIKWF